MTRKRAKKLLMAKGLSRNAAEKRLDAKWPGMTNGILYTFEFLNLEYNRYFRRSLRLSENYEISVTFHTDTDLAALMPILLDE